MYLGRSAAFAPQAFHFEVDEASIPSDITGGIMPELAYFLTLSKTNAQLQDKRNHSSFASVLPKSLFGIS